MKVQGTSELDGKVYVDGNLVITGAENGLYTENDDTLLIGTTGGTGTIIIGDGSQNVQVNSNIRADAGIDNDGDLNIGTDDDTDTINLGRAGQTIDMFSQERLNGNALVVNDAVNLTALTGCGLVYNAVGWGNGPSIDFYFAGAIARYVDSAGWH